MSITIDKIIKEAMIMIQSVIIEEGIYDNLSNEDYHGHKGSVSRSGLMEFDKSPFKYWSRYLNPKAEKEEQTPAMIFGSAFHAYVLEPEYFCKTYIVKPEFERLPKVQKMKDVGKETYLIQKKIRDDQVLFNADVLQEFESLVEDRIVITKKDYNTMLKMNEALKAHSHAYDLIKDAIYEQSYFWKDKDSGLILKCRPDIQHANMIVDLKTCADASPSGFQRAMVSGGYHIQGAMIRDAIRYFHNRDIPNVINIAIEKTYPYSIGIYIIDEAALESGHTKYKQLCFDLKKAIEVNEWNDYPIQSIGLPTWAI